MVIYIYESLDDKGLFSLTMEWRALTEELCLHVSLKYLPFHDLTSNHYNLPDLLTFQKKFVILIYVQQHGCFSFVFLADGY